MLLRKSPRVSVGMPVYNGERYVAEAIEAILRQTLPDWELVICDNASTDRTQEICSGYAARDPRIRYFRNPRNIGANGNFNRVAALADPTSDYFRWASHDDLCEPEHLKKCVRLLDANPAAVLCFPHVRLIDAQGEDLSAEELLQSGFTSEQGVDRHLQSPRPQQRFAGVLLRTRWCFEVFGVIRRSALARTAMQEDYYGTDKVILATLALLGPFLEVPEPLFVRRCHREQSASIRSVLARAMWSNPNVKRRPMFTQLPCLHGYLRALSTTTLFPKERIACRLIIARYLLQVRKLFSLMRDELSGALLAVTRPHAPQLGKATQKKPAIPVMTLRPRPTQLLRDPIRSARRAGTLTLPKMPRFEKPRTTVRNRAG